MILKDKKIVLMGVRNKWSIAWGAAKSAYENGAKLIVTYNPSNDFKLDKFKKLFEGMEGTKFYPCDVSSDESIEEAMKTIKSENGKIDGILHSIAHANREDLEGEYLETSREGFSHALDISAYSLTAVAKFAVKEDLLNEGASIVTYTYAGSERYVTNYNVMGIAKAALEASINYLAHDLGKRNIRINAISSGPIKTLSAKGIHGFNSILDIIEERAPLHKNVTIDQVGNATAFLLSDMSSAITGEIIHVDNGFTTVGVEEK